MVLEQLQVGFLKRVILLEDDDGQDYAASKRARQAQVGGVAGEGTPLFEVGDLSTLWVDLHIFGNDTQHITAGVPVTVSRMTDGVSQATTLERVLPGTATLVGTVRSFDPAVQAMVETLGKSLG